MPLDVPICQRGVGAIGVRVCVCVCGGRLGGVGGGGNSDNKMLDFKMCGVSFSSHTVRVTMYK